MHFYLSEPLTPIRGTHLDIQWSIPFYYILLFRKVGNLTCSADMFLKNWVPSSKRYHSSSMVQQPRSDLGHLTVEVPRSHKIRHTQPAGLLLTNAQPVEENPAYTTNTRDKHPSPQRDSNPRSQQSSGRRTTPETARPTNRRTEATYRVLYTQVSDEIPV